MRIVTLEALERRFQIRQEMYTFLTEECGVFLPGEEMTTVRFMSDIMHGRKSVSVIS